ncbi:MAG: DUF47 family protein, partial [Bacteroidales bacterium]|nr:DUF47 family protein [Bacteroidales bacterium]
GDLMRLLELMDYMVNIMYKNLYQFEIENPFFPDDVTEDFLTLADYSTKAVEGVIPAAEAYFQKPETVASRLHRIYNFQKKADKLSQSIKWRVFHSMDFLKLSQKFHLRYFALHMENISEAAGRIADQLSVMAIKHEDQQTALNSEEKMKAFRDFEQNLFHRMKFNEDIGGLYSDASTVQKDFSQRITNLYPNLSATEKKLATLLRLDFSTKDIATMMNITPKSVEIARYRLRTKLKLKRSDNLVEFIKTI